MKMRLDKKIQAIINFKWLLGKISNEILKEKKWNLMTICQNVWFKKLVLIKTEVKHKTIFKLSFINSDF